MSVSKPFVSLYGTETGWLPFPQSRLYGVLKYLAEFCVVFFEAFGLVIRRAVEVCAVAVFEVYSFDWGHCESPTNNHPFRHSSIHIIPSSVSLCILVPRRVAW